MIMNYSVLNKLKNKRLINEINFLEFHLRRWDKNLSQESQETIKRF